MPTLLNGIAPTVHLGVLQASGEDSRKFLHSQLSNDFALLGHDKARLAAFLSAKGRMLASFIGLRHGEHDVLLIAERSLLEAAQKRLSMFVLRAKTKISDVSDQWQLHGLAGDAVAALAGQTQAPWDLQRQDGDRHAIRLYPALDAARALWLAPAGTPPPEGPALAAQNWLWSEVESGIATLSAPVADAFVPQMLNYESVDGVNFKKGCYPGQEVVARSQFRGAIKRRAYLAHASRRITAGEEIFAAAEQGPDAQPCGLVVQATPSPLAANAFAAIVSLQTSRTGEPLEVRQASGAEAVGIAVSPVPYPLRDDI